MKFPLNRWANTRRFLPGIAGTVLWLLLLPIFFGSHPRPVLADDGSDLSCDSLSEVTPREGTVWSWFEHPCPPAPEEETPAILPGVGVTLQGFWIPTTRYNPTGTPVTLSQPLINDRVQNGFGGGLEITGWLSQSIAGRFQANLWDFPPQAGQTTSFTMLPVLLGLEIKLLGDSHVYLYISADGGVAFNGQNLSNAFDGASTSPYAQLSVGLNVYALQIEAGYGVLMNPLQPGSEGVTGTGGKSNPFFIIPLSVGFHL